ncbi:hypothetical protein [Thermoleptolyngbya sp. C42_A2020_037]|uniref:hypothetical protein n=1 Tax=Thermoleptolyngbya sp. C42_A2020_037 TaxID=2747799 RepID=UPI001A0F225E|nr:hypothetical protein [Thermoleptolyngbya sp. C42_A2020_037]MBF2085402.1 hypothetical protein [Thermoleptolyngbya sp. C42_A2020_037]
MARKKRKVAKAVDSSESVVRFDQAVGRLFRVPIQEVRELEAERRRMKPESDQPKP